MEQLGRYDKFPHSLGFCARYAKSLSKQIEEGQAPSTEQLETLEDVRFSLVDHEKNSKLGLAQKIRLNMTIRTVVDIQDRFPYQPEG